MIIVEIMIRGDMTILIKGIIMKENIVIDMKTNNIVIRIIEVC